MPQLPQSAGSNAGLRFVVLAFLALSAVACASDTLDPSTGVAIAADTPEGLASDSLATSSVAVQGPGLDSPDFLTSTTSSTPFGSCTTLGDVLCVLRLADRAGVRLWIDVMPIQPAR